MFIGMECRKQIFYLTMHSAHFINSYMTLDTAKRWQDRNSTTAILRGVLVSPWPKTEVHDDMNAADLFPRSKMAPYTQKGSVCSMTAGLSVLT